MFKNRIIKMAYPILGYRETLAVTKVLKSKVLSAGPQNELFEKNFSSYLENLHCVSVNSGTSALYLSLLANGIGKGDEVIVPSFSFAATANVVKLVGATPIFVDIEEDSYCMDPVHLEYKITSRTKAVIVVHLYGNPANLISISKICQNKNILLFEDAAQAHGAEVEGRKIGTWGICNSFSFYPTKNITTAEGGLISTSNSELNHKLRLLRNQGMIIRYRNEIPGFNLRLSELHASIGNEQFKKLKSFNEKRISNANFYNNNLKNIITPVIKRNSKHVFNQYTIRIPNMTGEDIRSKLKTYNIESAIYYPIPIHRLPSFNNKIYLPITEKMSNECISIPVHPGIKSSEKHKIVEILNKIAVKKI